MLQLLFLILLQAALTVFTINYCRHRANERIYSANIIALFISLVIFPLVIGNRVAAFTGADYAFLLYITFTPIATYSKVRERMSISNVIVGFLVWYVFSGMLVWVIYLYNRHRRRGQAQKAQSSPNWMRPPFLVKLFHQKYGVPVSIRWLLLFILYVLSSGPALMFYDKHLRDLYQAVFWPLWKFEQSSSASREILIQYWSFWCNQHHPLLPDYMFK